MITRSPTIVHTPGWQQQLARGFTLPRELLEELDIDAGDWADRESQPFALRVPRGFVARMEKGNPDDPLLLQVLPQLKERELTPACLADPLQELAASPAPGIIHKYRGRVLLITTGACAIHCRYCFRRHFPYQEHHRSREQWREALDYLHDNTSVTEVILSGGDPLVMSDSRIADLVSALGDIKHLRRLRIHTRLPVVLPERVTPGLLNILKNSRLRCSMVIHCNHPNELDDSVASALQKLGAQGIALFNQSVLLRKVNDNAQTLADLSEALFDCGAIPYYLHLLDPVAGAAHFNIPEAEARALFQTLLELLPGYLVPKLVRESPLVPYKHPLSPP